MKTTAAALSVAMVGSRVLAGAGASKRPNLLFIMTDQQRFDAMSCAGNTVIKTPNMDRIANEGAIFKNAYTANPICVPARASFLTGLSPVNVRVEGNGDKDSKDVPNVPTFDSVLKEHGYAAEYYGKWHTPHQFTKCYDNDVRTTGRVKGAPSQMEAYHAWLERKGLKQKNPGAGELYSKRNLRPYKPISLDGNYDKADLDAQQKLNMKASQSAQYGCVDLPPKISYTTFIVEETLETLDRLKEKPFTLTCSIGPPHPPMTVQEPYYSMFPPETIPVPESINDPMTDSPYKQRRETNDKGLYQNAEHIKNMRSIYYGMVREVDDRIGDILDKLDQLGIADNTLVIFTSDHGEMLGDHGMHSKMIFYEGSVHVPLLMRLPGRIKARTIVEEPVSTMDIFSTILDYLGMPIPENNGISLRPFIEGKPVEHDVVSFSRGGNTPNYMIRSGHLKLMMAQSTKSKNAINALYDLESDPHETRNLILSPIAPEKNRAQAKQMRDKLIKWLEKHEPHKVEELKEVNIL